MNELFWKRNFRPLCPNHWCVANILTKLGITYYCEKPIEFAPNDFRLPDFTATYKGQTMYWEHLGMLNLPYYKRDWERRRKWYERHNLIDMVITPKMGQMEA